MQMTLIEREQIEELATQGDGPRISIYLPTHRAGQEASQAPIRLKNRLTAAREELVAKGVRSVSARHLLEPARRLLDDREFWLHQADGLAVFLSSQGMRTFRLPFAVDELHTVSNQYHLKPLLGLLVAAGRFFILAVSLNRIRLFEAKREMTREIDLEGVPLSLRETIDFDSKKRSLQYRTGTGPASGGKRTAAFHGQGSRKEERKNEIVGFLRVVDEGVKKVLAGERAPVVLAGVGRITATYRAVTSWPHVLEETVEANPDRLSPKELSTRAWAIVEPDLQRGLKAAVERYQALAGTGRASNDLGVVLKAAFEGRVDTLLVARNTQCWGTWLPHGDSPAVEVHSEQLTGDRDLLDLAAIKSFVQGGDVYLLEPDWMPGRSKVAAIFRY